MSCSSTRLWIICCTSDASPQRDIDYLSKMDKQISFFGSSTIREKMNKTPLYLFDAPFSTTKHVIKLLDLLAAQSPLIHFPIMLGCVQRLNLRKECQQRRHLLPHTASVLGSRRMVLQVIRSFHGDFIALLDLDRRGTRAHV